MEDTLENEDAIRVCLQKILAEGQIQVGPHETTSKEPVDLALKSLYRIGAVQAEVGSHDIDVFYVFPTRLHSR